MIRKKLSDQNLTKKVLEKLMEYPELKEFIKKEKLIDYNFICLAGQSVASAIIEVLGLPIGTPINDIDIFAERSVIDGFQEKLNILRVYGRNQDKENSTIMTFCPDYEHYYSYINEVYKQDYVILESKKYEHSKINFTLVNFISIYNEKEKISSLIKSFDINSTQVAISLKTGQMFFTEDFVRFLEEKILRISAYNTPNHSFVRLIKKGIELGVETELENSIKKVAYYQYLFLEPIRKHSNLALPNLGLEPVISKIVEKTGDYQEPLFSQIIDSDKLNLFLGKPMFFGKMKYEEFQQIDKVKEYVEIFNKKEGKIAKINYESKEIVIPGTKYNHLYFPVLKDYEFLAKSFIEDIKSSEEGKRILDNFKQTGFGYSLSILANTDSLIDLVKEKDLKKFPLRHLITATRYADRLYDKVVSKKTKKSFHFIDKTIEKIKKEYKEYMTDKIAIEHCLSPISFLPPEPESISEEEAIVTKELFKSGSDLIQSCFVFNDESADKMAFRLYITSDITIDRGYKIFEKNEKFDYLYNKYKNHRFVLRMLFNYYLEECSMKNAFLYESYTPESNLFFINFFKILEEDMRKLSKFTDSYLKEKVSQCSMTETEVQEISLYEFFEQIEKEIKKENLIKAEYLKTKKEEILKQDQWFFYPKITNSENVKFFNLALSVDMIDKEIKRLKSFKIKDFIENIRTLSLIYAHTKEEKKNNEESLRLKFIKKPLGIGNFLKFFFDQTSAKDVIDIGTERQEVLQGFILNKLNRESFINSLAFLLENMLPYKIEISLINEYKNENSLFLDSKNNSINFAYFTIDLEKLAEKIEIEDFNKMLTLENLFFADFESTNNLFHKIRDSLEGLNSVKEPNPPIEFVYILQKAIRGLFL